MSPRRSKHDRRHGIENEPHLRATNAPKPGEHGVDPDQSNRLDEEPVRATSEDGVVFERDEVSDHTVYDEPAFVVRGEEDARALRERGYGAFVAERMRATGLAPRALTFGAIIALAGPAAVIGALIQMFAQRGGAFAGVASAIVLTPVVEEMMKIVLLLWVVERRPWLLTGSAMIVALGAAGGAGFGAIENLIHLHVYVPDADASFAAWRWSVCLPMHVGASSVAAIGLAVMWRRVRHRGERASIQDAFPWLVGAMLIHGGYNAFAIAISRYAFEDSLAF